MSFGGMGKSIQKGWGNGPEEPPPRFIFWMSFQLAIPRRGALQQSPLPLHQPRTICVIIQLIPELRDWLILVSM